ncbi:hypothetical protein PG984_007200 [Apiospora sp. TS-2023a]
MLLFPLHRQTRGDVQEDDGDNGSDVEMVMGQPDPNELHPDEFGRHIETMTLQTLSLYNCGTILRGNGRDVIEKHIGGPTSRMTMQTGLYASLRLLDFVFLVTRAQYMIDYPEARDPTTDNTRLYLRLLQLLLKSLAINRSHRSSSFPVVPNVDNLPPGSQRLIDTFPVQTLTEEHCGYLLRGNGRDVVDQRIGNNHSEQTLQSGLSDSVKLLDLGFLLARAAYLVNYAEVRDPTAD